MTLNDVAPEDLAYSYLGAYVAMQYPKYDFAAHHIAIIHALQQVEKGEIRRLIINVAPRHGKTLLASEFFPAWYIGRNPEHQIIAATYSFERAGDTGRKIRNQLIDPLHNKIFPGCTISLDNKGANRMSTEQGGNVFSLGVGGGLTGRGANCCHGDTILITPDGPAKISEIIKVLRENNSELFVLSFDHAVNKACFRKVVAHNESQEDTIYEISTNNGHKLRVTGEHKILVIGSGYVEAKTLRPGDRIRSICMQDMRTTDKEKIIWRHNLSNMSRDNAFIKNRSNLPILRETRNEVRLRNQKNNKKRAQRSLLFTRMLKKTSCFQEQAKVQYVRNSCRKKDPEILSAMQTSSRISPKTQTKRMSNLRKKLSSAFYSSPILRKRMCGYSSFTKNDRPQQFPFQRRTKLRKAFFGNEISCFRKRQVPMCCLWENWECETVPSRWNKNNQKHITCSSYQRTSGRQSSLEFDNNLSNMSWETPQINDNTISMVQKICNGTIPVYDIQVEGTNNFFADGILCHNCLLIDDPIRGREEAESESAREKLIDWYRGVAYTRLMPDNRIILIQTRWHYYDLTGYLLEENKHEKWHILSLPAIAESEDMLGRKPGEALWPNSYPISKLNEIKETIGSREWSAQYQQQPMTGDSSLVNIDWFQRYDYYEMGRINNSLKYKRNKIKMPFGIKKIVCSWDTAFKEDQLNDPSSCTVWGISDNGYYLLYVFNKRLAFPELKKAVITIYEHNKAYNLGAIPVLIEDKASGQSLIQELRKTSTIPIIPIKADGNKVTRLSEVTAVIEAGKVFLPTRGPWLADYELQLAQFPYSKHDDMVDSTSQFLRWADKPKYISSGTRYWK